MFQGYFPSVEAESEVTKQDNDVEQKNVEESGTMIEHSASEQKRRPTVSVYPEVRRSPAEMDTPELQSYLKNFYLIKTPYGKQLQLSNLEC